MSTTTLSKDAQLIVDDLTADGYTPDDIRRIMEDGEYLGSEGISQDLAEDIHDWALSATKHNRFELMRTIENDLDNQVWEDEEEWDDAHREECESILRGLHDSLMNAEAIPHKPVEGWDYWVGGYAASLIRRVQ